MKTKIGNLIGIQNHKQILSFSDTILEDKNSIDYYNITQNSVINCIIIEEMVINVKVENGNTIKIKCKPSDAISRIKDEISKKIGYFEYMILYISGTILENNKLIEDYNIQYGTVINLKIIRENYSFSERDGKLIYSISKEINKDKKDNKMILHLGIPGLIKKNHFKDDSKIINELLK